MKSKFLSYFYRFFQENGIKHTLIPASAPAIVLVPKKFAFFFTFGNLAEGRSGQNQKCPRISISRHGMVLELTKRRRKSPEFWEYFLFDKNTVRKMIYPPPKNQRAGPLIFLATPLSGASSFLELCSQAIFLAHRCKSEGFFPGLNCISKREMINGVG